MAKYLTNSCAIANWLHSEKLRHLVNVNKNHVLSKFCKPFRFVAVHFRCGKIYRITVLIQTEYYLKTKQNNRLYSVSLFFANLAESTRKQTYV